MKTKLLFLALAMVLVVPASLMADSIPYGNIGTQAPVNVFTATSTGPLTAYFFTSDAGYTSNIGMLINDVSTGVFGLNNHLSSHGDSVVLGNVNAGDTIEFQLYVYDLGYSWYSNPADNSDGINHVYSTTFSGDANIPAGIYVAFEDLPGGGDFDYNDHQFVFTNVRTGTSVPEPGTFFLLGTGVTGLLGVMRRKLRA